MASDGVFPLRIKGWIMETTNVFGDISYVSNPKGGWVLLSTYMNTETWPIANC